MTVVPMHRFRIAHDWIEADRIWLDGNISTVFERCRNCEVDRRVLDLDSKHVGIDRGFIRSATSDSLQSRFEQLRSNSHKMDRVLKTMDSVEERIVYESDHNSIEELITEIEKRCQGTLDGYALPYSQLWRWIDGGKQHRVKNLLVYFQGPVCNRCDRVFSPLVEPTVDHINGDRSNAHPSNLQLLCKKCNNKKAKDPPRERDIAPFTYQGEPCEHRLSCAELRAIQAPDRVLAKS